MHAERGSPEDSSAPNPAEDKPDGPTAEYRAALELWLQWNEAHERLCADLFRAGRDPKVLQDMMDQLDTIRQRAVELSRKLLSP